MNNVSFFKVQFNTPILFVVLFFLFAPKNTNGRNSHLDNEIELTFSHKRDLCDQPFELSITSNNPAANIIYTLDCSTPSKTNGIIYSNGIQIDSTIVVKAIALVANNTSRVYTNSYLFPASSAKQGKKPAGFPAIWGGSSKIRADYEMDPEIVDNPEYSTKIIAAFKSIPSLSLSMNVDEWFNRATGIYVGYPNSNETREKPVTAEFLFNNNEENFVVECGVQNQGGTSIINWMVPKQSMRLLFKSMYGPKKLKKKLFPDSEIKSINTLVLDGYLNTWLHPWYEKQRSSSILIRDQLASDLQNKMGWLSFHGRFVHLFLNGLYWGLYDLHERPDDAFLAEYLDAKREDFDIIKHSPRRIVQGSNDSYLNMLKVARSGLTSEKKLKAIQKYLDLPAFIDYMILNFYLGNYDWAHHNYYAARNKKAGTGFRFYSWDSEDVMRYADVNYNNTSKNDENGPTEIHMLLKENKEYRLMFADAVYKHLYNSGALTPQNFKKSFLFRKNEIEDAIILESARWGDFLEKKSGVVYTKKFWDAQVTKLLTEYIPYRRDVVIKQFQSKNNKLFPEFLPPLFKVHNQSVKNAKFIELTNPNSIDGDIYYTTDGSDPRKWGGAIRGKKYSEWVKIKRGKKLKARFYSSADGSWSALAEN